MADATHSNPTPATEVLIKGLSPRIINLEMPCMPRKAHLEATPLPATKESFQAQREPQAHHSLLNNAKSHLARRGQRQRWATLDLRQRWADEAFMRGHLRAARVKVGSDSEPATVSRMKSKLRAVGIHSPEIQEAVGMPLGRFLEANPKLPLWAALALVLESTGRFTPEGFGGDA